MRTALAFDLFMARSATISPCGKYRYRLWRKWGEGPSIAFVMLNPSTADADIDDPTIRRCIAFARREGAGSLLVVNLFGLRSTDPDVLSSSDNPTGPENWFHVEAAMDEAETIVCAWGAHPFALKNSYALQQTAGRRRLVCLGKTKDGYPRHPLYVKAVQPFVPF